MMKYVDTAIVFQEIPDELTMAVNISNCPIHCEGCHSPYLQADTGKTLDEKAIDDILSPYKDAITCVCLMGGDATPEEVAELAAYIRSAYPSLRTAWYSGRQQPSPQLMTHRYYDYVKVGPYIKAKGPLNSPTTNQRLFRINPDDTQTDITSRFWHRHDR